MKKILIIEDDVNLGTTVMSALETHDYTVHYLTGSEKINNELNNFEPDIILLDVMLQEALTGFDIAKQIRMTSNVPIVFTTSLDGNNDFSTAFGIANTDYIRKPYGVIELLMRIKKLLDKQVHIDSHKIGKYTFYSKANALKINGEDTHLTNLETMVLLILCKQACEFIRKKDLIEQVWKGEDGKSREGSLNNILSSLRKHLQKDPQLIIETKFGIGIRLKYNSKKTY